jgi:hypothetical protein
MDGIVALFLMVLYFAVLIYLISLFSRFVQAVERIANKIEASSKI